MLLQTCEKDEHDLSGLLVDLITEEKLINVDSEFVKEMVASSPKYTFHLRSKDAVINHHHLIARREKNVA